MMSKPSDTESQAEAHLAHVMASAVRRVVSSFDFFDLAHQLTTAVTRLLEAQAAGVMLEDSSGRLQVLSASDEDTHVLEVFELQREEGPCYDCWRSGEALIVPDLQSGEQWPAFQDEARARGLVSAAAVPLRFRERTIGALNVFWDSRWVPTSAEMSAAQAVADVAVVGLVQQRAGQDYEVLATNLETALRARVAVEQAKGLVAAKSGMTISDSFREIARYADECGQSLSYVAAGVLDRTITWNGTALSQG